MSKDKDILSNPNNVRFADLLKFCKKFFGEPRIRGSHHIFQTPWSGEPVLNFQRDGNMAKPYQVIKLRKAIEKIEEMKRRKMN